MESFGNLVTFPTFGHISWPFVIFNGNLVHFLVIWYIFLRFGMFYEVKSGNPVGQWAAPSVADHAGKPFFRLSFDQKYG
jgi:hypothetical protein